MKQITNYFKTKGLCFLCTLLLISMMIVTLSLSVIAVGGFTDEKTTLNGNNVQTQMEQKNTDHLNNVQNTSDDKDPGDGNDIHLGIVTSSLDEDIPYSYDAQTGHTYHAEKNNGTHKFTVELSQAVDYDVQFRLCEQRVSYDSFTSEEDFISEYDYEKYSSEWYDEYYTKSDAFYTELETQLASEGNLFVLSNEIRTITAGETSMDVEFTQIANAENGTGTRLSEISLVIVTNGVGQNFDTGYRGMVTYHIYDLDGENGLIILTPANVYENDGYVEIPVIRTGDNTVTVHGNVPSFTYKLSNNINIGGETEITASQRFENYNSVFTFKKVNGVYKSKDVLRLNIIDNADIGYLEQYKAYFSNFVNLGDTITTTILGEKFNANEKISVTFSIFDDEYELLDMTDYSEVNLLYNQYDDPYISVVYYDEYNIILNEDNATKNLIVSMVRGSNAPIGEIRLGYALTMDDGFYGESFTIGGEFNEFTHQGAITIADGETQALIPINLIDDKAINSDVTFKLKFYVLEGDNVLLSRGKSTLGVKIVENDYLPTESYVEFGYFNNIFWDGETVDLRRPGIPENYVSDGEVDAVISTFTYLNTVFPLVLYSNDYRGNIPMIFAVKVEDVTATSGIDYSVPSQIIYVETDLLDTDAVIEFIIKNQLFEGVRRFKFTIMEEYLPEGIMLGEKSEFVVDIIGMMPEGFCSVDKNDISVKKGENILLTLTRYSRKATTTQIGITDLYGNDADTSVYFADGTFPMSIDWEEGETTKSISIPVLNDKKAEQYSTYLKLSLLDNNGNPISNTNLDEYNTSCSFNIDNTYNGGYFYFDSDRRAYLQEDSVVRFYMARSGNVSEEATIYYRLSEDESVSESERAIDGIDFVSGEYSYTFAAGESEAYIPVELPEYATRKGDLRKLKVELIGTSNNAVLCSNHYQFAEDTSYFTQIQLWLDWDTQATVSNISQKPHLSPYENGTLTSGVICDNYENASGEFSPTLDDIYRTNIVLDFTRNSSISLNVKNVNLEATLQTETSLYLFVANDLTAQGITISYDGKVLVQRTISTTEQNIFNNISRVSSQGGPQAVFVYYYKVDFKLNNDSTKVLNFTLEEGYNAENVNFDLYPVFYGGIISNSANEYFRNIITNGYTVEQGVAQSYDLGMHLYSQNDINLLTEINFMSEYGVDSTNATSNYQLKLTRSGDISTMLSLYLGINNAILGKDLSIYRTDGNPVENGALIIFSTGESEKILNISIPKNKSYDNVTSSIGLYTDSACKNLVFERIYNINNAEKIGTFEIIPALNGEFDYVDTDEITIFITRHTSDLLAVDAKIILDAPYYQVHSTWWETYVNIYSNNYRLPDGATLHFNKGQSTIELRMKVDENSPIYMEWKVGVTNAWWEKNWFEEQVTFTHFNTEKNGCKYSEEESTTTEKLNNSSKLPQSSPRQWGDRICGYLGSGFSNLRTNAFSVNTGMYELGDDYYLNVKYQGVFNRIEEFWVGNSNTGTEIKLDIPYNYDGNHLQYAIYDFNGDNVQDIMFFATFYDDFYDNGAGVFIYDVKTNTMRKVLDTPEWYENYSFGIRDLDANGNFEFFYLYSPNAYSDYMGDTVPETVFDLYEILSDGTFKRLYTDTTNSQGHHVYHYEVVEASENNVPYIRLYHYAGSEWHQYTENTGYYTFDTSYSRICLMDANNGVTVNVSGYTVNENGEIEITVCKPGDYMAPVTIEITDTNLLEGLNITSLAPQTIIFSADEHIKTIKYKFFEDKVNKTDLYIDFKVTTACGIFWNSTSPEFRVNVKNITYVTSDIKYSVQDEITDRTICPSFVSGNNLLIDANYLEFNTGGLDGFEYQLQCQLSFTSEGKLKPNYYNNVGDTRWDSIIKTWHSEMNTLNLSINDLPTEDIYTNREWENATTKYFLGYKLEFSVKVYYKGQLYHTYYTGRVICNNNISDEPIVDIAPSGTTGHYWNIYLEAKEPQRFNYDIEIIDENGKSNFLSGNENGIIDAQYLLPEVQGTYDYTVKIYNRNLGTIETREFELMVYGSAQIGLLTLFEYDSRSLSVEYVIKGIDNNFYATGYTDENGIAIVERIPAGKKYRITLQKDKLNLEERQIFLSNDNYMETFNMTMSSYYYLTYTMSKINRNTFNELYQKAALQLNKGNLLEGELDFGWAIIQGAEKANQIIVQMTGKAPNKLVGQQKAAYDRAVEIIYEVRNNLLRTDEYVYFNYGGENLFNIKNLPTAPEYVELEEDEFLYCVLRGRSGAIGQGMATIKSLYGTFDFNMARQWRVNTDPYAVVDTDSYNGYMVGWTVCKDDDYYELELHENFLFAETDGKKTIPLLSIGAGLATSLVQDVDSVMAEIEDIEIPDNIKFFGGATLGLGIGNCSDLEYEYDKENMTLSIRLGAAKDINNIGNDPDKLLREFKSALRNNKSGALKMGGGYANLDVGVGAVIEYFYNTETRMWELDWGRMYFATSYTIGYTVYAVVPVVYIPVYINGEVTLSTEIGLVLDWNNASQEVYVDGDASVAVRLHIEAGIGVPGLLSVGIYGETEIKISIQFSTGGSKTELYVDGGVKLTVLFWRKTISFGRYENEWTSDGWREYTTRALYSSRLSEFEQLTAYSGVACVYDAGIMTAAYALDEGGEVAGTLFVENVYESAIPQIAEHTDGTKMMAWINYDATRGVNNAEVINYIYFDGETWSDVKVVDASATADVDFSLEVIDGKYVLAYLDVDNLTEDDTISNRLLKTDASMSVYDEQSETWNKTVILNNDYNDNRILMCTDGTSAVILVYETRNTNITDDMTVGDYLGGENANNVLLVKSYRDGEWSDFSVLLDTDIPPIVNMSCIVIDNIAYILLNLDMDSDFTTVKDREIMLVKYYIYAGSGEKEFLTNDEIKDSAPVVVELDGKPVYIYNSGNELKYIIDGVYYTLDTDFDADLEDITAYSSDEYIALVWECIDEVGKQQISMSLLDKTNKRFSEPFAVTTTDKVSRDAIVLFTENGAALYFCDDTYTPIYSEVADDNGEYPIDDFIVTSEIVMQEYIFTSDIQIIGLDYKVEELKPGEMNEIVIKIINNGILAVNNAQIKLYNGETLIGEYQINGIIRGGGYLEYIMYVTLPEESFTLSTELYEGDTLVSNENFDIIMRDLAVVSYASSERENDYKAVVLVQNNGGTDEENVKVYIVKYSDSSVIYGESTIAFIESKESVSVSFDICKEYASYNGLGLAWFKVIILADGETLETLSLSDYETTNNIYEMFISESDMGEGIMTVPSEVTLDINESSTFEVIYTGNGTLTYSSADEGIATVSGTTITAVGIGTTTIIVSDGSYTAYISVTVSHKPQIILNGDTNISVLVGKRYKEQGADVMVNGEIVEDAKISIRGSVNNLVCSKYVITYTYSQGGKIVAIAKRTINVIPVSPTFTPTDDSVSGYAVNRSEIIVYTEENTQIATLIAENNSFSFNNLSDGTYYLRTSINGILSDKSETFIVSTDTPVIENYTVTWKNEDGAILEVDTVSSGTVPNYDGTTPTKAATAQYTYTFKSWDKEVVAITGNATYTATFASSINNYTVTWKGGDGTILKIDTVSYGTVPAYNEDTLIKTGTAQYTYTFKSWDKEVVTVTGNATYTATFTSSINNYTVTWKGEDGTILKIDTVSYGTVPAYNEATPIKAATAQYTYTFKSWDKEVVAITGNATYTATFASTINKYLITWIVNGKEITEQVEFGTVPTFKGSTDKPADANTIYTFIGWNPEVVRVEGNATYTSQYEESVNTDEIAVTRFKNEVAAIAGATTREEKYIAITTAINSYNSLTDKSRVVNEYNTLKAAVGEYNTYVENANEELTKATDVAVRIVSSTLDFMLALVGVWIVIKKLLSGGKN